MEYEDDGAGLPGEDAEETYEDVMKRDFWLSKPYNSDDFASDVIERVDEHFLQAHSSGLAETILRSWRMYHSLEVDGDSNGDWGTPVTSPQFLGEQGEFTYAQINHYRNYVLHKKALVTSERPAFEPHASTNDPDAKEQVNLAGNVLDYAMDQRGLNQALDDGVEVGLVMASSYIQLGWDPDASDTGDLSVQTLTPLEVVHQKCRSFKDAEWVITRTFESRYGLAAKAARAGDSDLAMEIVKSEYGSADFQFSPIHYDEGQFSSSERIPVYNIFVKHCPQYPQGRYARVTGDALVLQDGPTPFVEIPVYRYAPNEFVGTATPYANSWDTMAIHTMENAVISAIVSRIDAFGVPNVAYTEGTEFGVDDFGGLTLTAVPPGMPNPQLIELLNMPAGLPQAVKMLEDQGDKISGINSVVRGQPADNISSGSMAALVQAQAVQFNSPDERAFTYLAENVGTGIIKIYQAFADVDMLITVSGDDPRIVTNFKGDAISKIARVSVQRTNPLTKTNAWKQDAANQLLAQGVINSPQEYMAVIQTGTYKALFSDDVALLAFIQDENNRLIRGEQGVTVGQLERHDLHISEHQGKLDSRLRQSNPQAAQMLEMHIGEHMKHWMNLSISNPGMLMAMKMQPLPPPPQVAMQMQQAGMGGEGQPPPEAKGKPGPEKKPQVKGTNAAAGSDKEPKMPQAPKNPATGQKADI